jgi:hypothetical protein
MVATTAGRGSVGVRLTTCALKVKGAKRSMVKVSGIDPLVLFYQCSLYVSSHLLARSCPLLAQCDILTTSPGTLQGVAAQSSLRVDDVLLAIDGKDCTSLEALVCGLFRGEENSHLRLLVCFFLLCVSFATCPHFLPRAHSEVLAGAHARSWPKGSCAGEEWMQHTGER